MAIRYSDLKKDIESKPISSKGLEYINILEDYIDGTIKKQFDINKSIYIELEYIQFRGTPYNNYFEIDLSSTEKEKMTKEIEKRYSEAGWESKIEYGDDDGPNRPGQNYWVLKGK